MYLQIPIFRNSPPGGGSTVNIDTKHRLKILPVLSTSRIMSKPLKSSQIKPLQAVKTRISKSSTTFCIFFPAVVQIPYKSVTWSGHMTPTFLLVEFLSCCQDKTRVFLAKRPRNALKLSMGFRSMSTLSKWWCIQKNLCLFCPRTSERVTTWRVTTWRIGLVSPTRSWSGWKDKMPQKEVILSV